MLTMGEVDKASKQISAISSLRPTDPNDVEEANTMEENELDTPIK